MLTNIKIGKDIPQVKTNTDNIYHRVDISTNYNKVYLLIENEQTARTIHQLLSHCPIVMIVLPDDAPEMLTHLN